MTAERDPFHVRGVRRYNLKLWDFHESPILGVGVRAWLNGADTSYRGCRPPEE
ncbi:MAG: hypothetical protein HYY21_03115 [Candidatus Tectomicrobia bacterium]|nr:hypothetical protein [Candidatus Tectomicrobia bacterium]